MAKYIIFYSKITTDKEVGIIVDYPFYGGDAETHEEADQIAKKLVNDAQNQTTIIPKVFEKGDNTWLDVMEIAKNRFEKMAQDMYDSEQVMDRRKRKR